MVKIKVPATSANIGAGFDSLGVALGLYNTVCAEETDGGLTIDILDDTVKFLPSDERNLVYRSMNVLFDKVGYKPKGIHITLKNDIPVTRGLGSSSAGIVGGLIAANAMSGAALSPDEILDIAADIEGHPDNVAPAVMGGFTVNVSEGQNIKYVKTDVPGDLCFAAFIPDFPLSTKRARGVLPKTVSMRDAVYNSGRSALLMTSIMTGKYENIRVGVEDRLHQRYRKKLVPHIDKIFDLSYSAGALGVYLSGAGPTVIALVHINNTTFKEAAEKCLSEKMNNWHLSLLNADNTGAIVCDNNREV